MPYFRPSAASAANISWLINYVTNPDAETDTTGWANYADAAGSSPVDGTGGSPVTAIARSTSSPLRGTGSFTWAKSANNRQGEGTSYDFTIDAADQGQVLGISFNYTIASGTFVDNDMSIWIYDKTNSVLIQPAPYQILNTTTNIQWSGSFQAASNSTSYRLIFHTASTSASAYTLKWDNVVIGPRTKVYGPLATDWVSFTPTGSWSTNVSYVGYWRRVGDSMEIQAAVTCSGAPTSANLSINLPSGYSIDTTKLAQSANSSGVVGYGDVRDAGTNSYPVFAAYNGVATSISAFVPNASGTYDTLANVTQAAPITFGASDTVRIFASVPIVGWSSGMLLGADADTRVIAARLEGTTGATYTSGNTTVVPYNASKFDTHGALSTANSTFTAPVPGYYRVIGAIAVTGGTYLVNSQEQIDVYVNGSVRSRLSTEVTSASAYSIGVAGSADIQLNAGDVVDLRYTGVANSGTLAFSTTAASNFFSITRVSGPAQIAASESVNATAYLSANQTGVNTNNTHVKINFDTREFDSHAAWDTTNKKYVAPISGVYSISLGVVISSTNVLANIYAAEIWKNGVLSQDFYYTAVVTTEFDVLAERKMKLLAGDVIEIYFWGAGNNSSSTLTAGGGTGNSYVSIARIGN